VAVIDWPSGPSTIHEVGTSRAGSVLYVTSRPHSSSPELRHDRVGRVAASPVGVLRPVHHPPGGKQDQPGRRECPDDQREDVQPGHVEGQRDRRVGDDPGAHDGGKPVRPEVPEDVSRPLKVLE
jgi:hypothetical protein